jgi:hypothetical protein
MVNVPQNMIKLQPDMTTVYMNMVYVYVDMYMSLGTYYKSP